MNPILAEDFHTSRLLRGFRQGKEIPLFLPLSFDYSGRNHQLRLATPFFFLLLLIWFDFLDERVRTRPFPLKRPYCSLFSGPLCVLLKPLLGRERRYRQRTVSRISCRVPHPRNPNSQARWFFAAAGPPFALSIFVFVVNPDVPGAERFLSSLVLSPSGRGRA